jgi:hypothetical protein
VHSASELVVLVKVLARVASVVLINDLVDEKEGLPVPHRRNTFYGFLVATRQAKGSV